MTKVHSLIDDNQIRTSVMPDAMDSLVKSILPVRRPLDIPSTGAKLGKVLSHSGCLAYTEKGYFLIEFMSQTQIFVTRCMSYKPGMTSFRSKKYVFSLDVMEPQEPTTPVTVREFAIKMKDFVAWKPFNTWTNNCHHARYDTMKFYGMNSENPDAGQVNLFYQGFVDFFRHY